MLVATVVEAELSVAVHATVADAAAWMGVDAESEGTRWAFQL